MEFNQNNVSLATQARKRSSQAKTSETRVKFLFAFEKTFGNVSASCEYAGIDRRTYYRWMKSHSRINRKFQKRVLAIRPVEKQLDIAEGRLMEKVAEGDMRAIELVLRKKGRSRGYGEVVNSLVLKSTIEKVANSYTDFAKDHEDMTTEERLKWLLKFAEAGDVDELELAERVGLGKLLTKVLGKRAGHDLR